MLIRFFVDRFLDDWCRRTMNSRLVAMKKVAKMLRIHRQLLLDWFLAKETRLLWAPWRVSTTRRK